MLFVSSGVYRGGNLRTLSTLGGPNNRWIDGGWPGRNHRGFGTHRALVSPPPQAISFIFEGRGAGVFPKWLQIEEGTHEPTPDLRCLADCPTHLGRCLG